MTSEPRPDDFPTELPWPYAAPKKKIQDWTPDERALHNKYVGWKRRGTTKRAEVRKSLVERGTRNLRKANESGAAALGSKAAAYAKWLAQRQITGDLRKLGDNLTQAFFDENREKVWACLAMMADYATKGFVVLPEVDQHGEFVFVNADNQPVGPNDPEARIKERVLRVADDTAHRGAIMSFLERIIGAPGKNINIKQDVHFTANLQGTLDDARRFRDEANKRFVPNMARPAFEAGAVVIDAAEAEGLDAVRADGRGAAPIPEQPDGVQGDGADYPEGDGRES